MALNLNKRQEIGVKRVNMRIKLIIGCLMAENT
jgi:hypothetical protein